MDSVIPETLAGLRVPIGDLLPYGRNPRRGNVEAIAESLQQNGQYRPVVANRRTSEVLAGNHTLAAARSLGWPELAVTWVDVGDEDAARIALIDNRASDLSEYDDEVLSELLASLPNLAGTGYTDDDLADLLSKVTPLPPVLADPDAAPELPKEPRSAPGDVWLLGPHKVICGDATDVTVFTRLLGDERPQCVWTDPPYGISYVGKTKEALTIHNDSIESLHDLLSSSLGAVLAFTDPGAAWYVAAPAGPASLDFSQVLTDLEVWRQTLVWVKSTMVLGHSDYHYKHEIIYTTEILYTGYTPGYLGRRGRGGEGWHGDNAQTSVLEFDKPSASREHPTMKPVALVVKCLENSSVRGDLVLDCFAGSGSTLIAAQVSGRIARVIELDPRYVDVICRRYQDVSGDKPILESTGEPHDFMEGS